MRGTGVSSDRSLGQDVPQVASLSGHQMTRPLLGAIGDVLLCISGIGIIAGLVWLTEGKLHGTLLQILDGHSGVLLYTVPALLFLIAIAGLALVGRALAPPTKHKRASILHHRMHFRA